MTRKWSWYKNESEPFKITCVDGWTGHGITLAVEGVVGSEVPAFIIDALNAAEQRQAEPRYAHPHQFVVVEDCDAEGCDCAEQMKDDLIDNARYEQAAASIAFRRFTDSEPTNSRQAVTKLYDEES